MPFGNYTQLQAAILDWIGRPNDPLVQPAVPDFIQLFEEEARDRLRTQFAELTNVALPPVTPGVFNLPNDFVQMRRVVYDSTQLEYRPPWDLADQTREGKLIGKPLWYTINGLQLNLGPLPDTNLTAYIDYSHGLPALGSVFCDLSFTWVYPSLYLFGSLVAAEAYIGNDERIAGWGTQRDASFERVRRAQIAARIGGAPLVQRVDGPTP
jgi:hypothetical protein